MNGAISDQELSDAAWELFELGQTRDGFLSWSPFFRFFDCNRDGIYEHLEAEWAADFLLDFLLPAAVEMEVIVKNQGGRRGPFSIDFDGPSGLAPEELEEIRRFFLSLHEEFLLEERTNETDLRWLDADESGEVEIHEVRHYRDMLSQALLKAWFALPPEEANSLQVRSVLDKAGDLNDDGVLSMVEREALIEGLTHPHEVRTAFDRSIDFDTNNEISMEEIHQARETGYIAVGLESAERRRPNGTADLDLGAAEEEGEDVSARTGKSAVTTSRSTSTGGTPKVKMISMKGSTLAVLGVRDLTEKLQSTQSELLVSFLENAFVNYGNVVVVDRQNLEKIMEEYKYQTSALVDEETAVEIGKLTGADAIAIANLSILADIYYLHLKVINVQTGAIIGSSISEGESEKAFLNMCNGAVTPLF